MGVRKSFGFTDIVSRAKKDSLKPTMESKIVRQLSYIGEYLCNHARNVTPSRASGGFDDQTGNLRSSIGYAIFKNGEKKKTGGFKDIKGAKDGVRAAESSVESFGYSVASLNGWTLVVVAGMNYARYVEAKGHNVLRLTRVEMAKKISELMSKL